MRLSSNIHYALIKSPRALAEFSYGCNSSRSPAFRFFTAVVAPHCRREEAQATTYSDLISVLRYTKTHRLLSVGKMVHGFVLRSGLEFDVYISNNLLSVYLSSGAIVHARQMFGEMLVKDSVSWNTMISGFVSLGLFKEGFVFFGEMIRLGTLPTHPGFVSILVACAEMGNSTYTRQVHSFIIKFGFSSFPTVGNSLLKGYVEFGEYEDWRKMLNDMPALDEISVQILLRGCVCHKIFSFAVELFRYSCSISIDVSPYTISSLVSLCSNQDNTYFGVQIHGFSQKVGMVLDVSVVNSLITMYSRTYTLHDAEVLFELCSSRDLVTWNSLISGYAYNGEGDAGFGLVQRLLSSGILLNESTFLSFLSCCDTIGILKNAKKAHALILKLREGFEERIDNVILTMYCKTRSLEDAAASFQATKVKDSSCLNLTMGLYRSFGRHEESINLLHMVQSQGSQMDEMMFSGVLSSCSRLGFLDFGCQIHVCVIKTGFGKISHLNNSILELYSQCGRVDDMERVFEEFEMVDLFSWNMMLMGYANIDLLFHKAIGIWHEMLKLDIKLNEFSYSALLHACCHADVLLIGEHIHSIIHKMGLTFDIALMNSLLTMYSNCKQMEKAHSVFEEIASPDSVSWNAMVSGYTQNGFPTESIELYRRMNKNGIKTNEMTYASIFSCCSLHANLKLGFQLHAQAVRRAFDLNLSVSNSLITMYARCGNIHESSQIFCRTQHPDLITWNSMINAYAHHGLGKEAISVFEQMNTFSEKPNSVTFIGILSSCSRAGLVSEAYHHFKIMDEVYGIVPTEEHCACIVDTLCRAGKLWDAKLFIESVSINNCSLVWRILLSFCKLNGDVKLGKVAAEKIIALEPCDSAPYVILSDLYAYLGDRTMKSHLRRLMENRGVKKETGCSWISS